MKYISLRNEEGFSYKKSLLDLLKYATTAESSFNMNDVYNSVKVQEKLENLEDGETLALEDSEWEYVKGRLSVTNFSVANRIVLDFIKEINSPSEG